MDIEKLLIERNVDIKLIKNHKFIKSDNDLICPNLYNAKGEDETHYFCKICGIILYDTLSMPYIIIDGTNNPKGWLNLICLNLPQNNDNDYNKLLYCNDYIVKGIIE